MDVDEEEVEQPSSSVKGDRKRFEVKKVSCYTQLVTHINIFKLKLNIICVPAVECCCSLGLG